jgi:glycosyltransferase involved in cell wall biosynthesis
MPPLVSIVIPCYKGERYLAEAVNSCLAQTHRELEVIIVNDASPDRCGEIADEFARRDPRVRVLHHPANQGVANAFNTGFDAARGEFMTRLAQDDLFAPHALAVMLQALQATPAAGMVYCDEQSMDENGQLLSVTKKPAPEATLVGGNKIGLCVMWRRTVWDKVGKFNPRYDTAEDYDYWLRIREHFPIIHCPEIIFYFRSHPGMGSRVFSVKQELLAAEISARHAATGRLRRKYLAEGFFNAGYVSGEQGQRQAAIKYLAQAITAWPFSFKPYKALARFIFVPKRRSNH